jgi:hypothetical protein
VSRRSKLGNDLELNCVGKEPRLMGFIVLKLNVVSRTVFVAGKRSSSVRL